MTKIVSFVDWSTTCVATTMGWGVEGLKNYLNCELQVYSYDDLKSRNITPDNDNLLLIFEIGNPQHAGLTSQDLRKWFPNSKLVALCSDTIYYQRNNLEPQLDPKDIDLHLEIMPQSVEWLQDKGGKADWFHWSISEHLICLATFFRQHQHGLYFKPEIKNIDFIGVYGPWTIENPECWRHDAVKYIKDMNCTFTQGGGNGHKDTDLYRLFDHYLSSWFTLGTSSHNRPELTREGCCKFFRDELGPLCNSLLIYDEHPNIKKIYGDIVPYYDYDDFSSIIHLHNELINTEYYEELLKKQKDWISEHSFEKNIVTKLIENKIISVEDLIDA
jgi:hypothetical protein